MAAVTNVQELVQIRELDPIVSYEIFSLLLQRSYFILFFFFASSLSRVRIPDMVFHLNGGTVLHTRKNHTFDLYLCFCFMQ